MATKTFAPWVEPIAARLRESRGQIVEEARTLPPELWPTPSPLQGWTYKDLLAHLAGDTGKISSEAMRAAVSGRRGLASTFADGGDVWNARDVEERRASTVAELVAEIEADGEDWRELLSHLSEADEEAQWPGFPVRLGEYLRILAAHDSDHLAQLRTALDNIML